MDPNEKLERKREARHRLRLRRQRVGQLRTRVVAISLIAFVLLWGVVFAQMATGNDPVLGASSSAIARSTAAAVATEAIGTTVPEELKAEVVEPEPVAEELVEAEPEPAPVTTSQS